MRQTAVVVAPGRGTYNKDELGYLTRHHAGKSALVEVFDAYRRETGQELLSALDGATTFSAAKHTRGDHASPLIYACACADFQGINRDRYDVVAVTGNSMGWYIALACAGALSALNGLRVVNTMGTLMQERLIGGQLIYPFVDEDWQVVPGMREAILSKMAEISARDGHLIMRSIELGGMLVLAGNQAGLDAFASEMPKVQGRFPLRLPNHAAFHTPMQEPVAEKGRTRLPQSLFAQPNLPLIDGRGGIWFPRATDLSALWRYTLDHQVVQPYDFTAAIRTAAREFMPDVFIILGPGATLGGAVVQSLIHVAWRGLDSRRGFQRQNVEGPILLSMGIEEQRQLVTEKGTVELTR